MWSYGPLTGSVSRPSWWGQDSSNMQSTWSSWRGEAYCFHFYVFISNPWWKRSVPHQYAIKRNWFSLWMNNTGVSGYTIADFTLAVLCCVCAVNFPGDGFWFEQLERWNGILLSNVSNQLLLYFVSFSWGKRKVLVREQVMIRVLLLSACWSLIHLLPHTYSREILIFKLWAVYE